MAQTTKPRRSPAVYSFGSGRHFGIRSFGITAREDFGTCSQSCVEFQFGKQKLSTFADNRNFDHSDQTTASKNTAGTDALATAGTQLSVM